MQPNQSRRTSAVLVAALFIWPLAVVVASSSGWLGSISPLAPPPIAALTMLIPALCYWFIPSVRMYLSRVGIRRLTAVHIFRIAAVPLFFWYGSRGLLPRSFVNAAGWGDLASGILAFGVVLFWPRPSGYWTAHIFGMLDFVTAFAIAIQLTVANPQSMHAITRLPMALIPFFGVGFLGAIHLIAYDLLLRHRGAQHGEHLHLHSAEVL